MISSPRRESATVICRVAVLAGDGVLGSNHPCALVAGLCDETDPRYDLRFDADEDCVRELIDRIDEMSLRGGKLCNRCSEKHPGRWQGKPGKAQCVECEQDVERHFALVCGAEDAPPGGHSLSYTR